MTKEQYLIFKSDLKKAIEVVKLGNKHRKAYWNDGFETQEDQQAAIKEDFEKRQEIRKTMSVDLDASNYFVHWAYYCAKHQLTDDEIKKYVEQEVKKLKDICGEWSINYAIKTYPESIKYYFSQYEKIVCTD